MRTSQPSRRAESNLAATSVPPAALAAASVLPQPLIGEPRSAAAAASEALGAAAPGDAGHPEREAHAALVDELTSKTGRIPPELVATHLLRVTPGADWPLRRTAAEALLRRIRAAREQGRAWEATPGHRPPVAHGVVTVRTGAGRRYTLSIEAAERLAGSCDCPDYLHNSLGLCKHLWWRFEALADKRRGLPPGAAPKLPLVWNPVRPLVGPGDWLARVACTLSPLPPPLASAFEPRDGRLRPERLAEGRQRLATVERLLTWIDEGAPRQPRADRALRALLTGEAQRLRERAGLRLHPSAVSGALARLERPLFPYQREGVERFLAAGRLLLADDMGLGKTAQAIASCHVLLSLGLVKRALVIVPAALKTQWQREWACFSRLPVEVVDGGPAERARIYRRLRRGSGCLVLNYELVRKDLPALLKLDPELVVLDEAQRIKNWEAKTSGSVKQLRPRWRLVLTGTPMENRLEELASIMEWIDAAALEPKWRLASAFSVRADGRREVTGARNLDTLRTRLAPSLLRRVRKEVLSQLPPRTDTAVPVPLTAEQLEAHSEYDRPIARLMRRAAKAPLTQPEFLRLMSFFTAQRVICNGLAQRDFEARWAVLQRGALPDEATLRGLFSPKLAELRELLRSLVVTQRRKVVVFSAWRRMLHLAQWAVSDVLAEAGLRAVRFTGEEGQRRRTQNIVDFHDDPATCVLFATDAGGVGLNLQRAASACVHLDLPWNPAVLEQRSGRVFRLGQRHPVDIYTLVGVGGIEERIAGLIEGKRALFEGLFDGTSDSITFHSDGSFLERLKVLAGAAALDAAPGDEDAADEDAADEDAADTDAPADTGDVASEVGLDSAPPTTEPGSADLAGVVHQAHEVPGRASPGDASAGENPPLESASGAANDLSQGGGAPASSAPAPAPASPSPSPMSLASGLTVRTLPDGRLQVDAEPGAAAILASALEAMAALLRQGAAQR